MDRKRMFMIIGFLAICAIFGYFLYRFFFQRAPAPVTPPPSGTVTPPSSEFPEAGIGTPGTGEGPDGELPAARPGTRPGQTRTEEPTVRQVVSDRITSARSDTGGAVRFYNTLDGKFYRVDENGNTRPLSDEVFYNVDKVTWSPAKSESIIEYPDGANIYYNFDTKRQVTLPRHWQEFSFAPQGDAIAAKSMGFSPENRWIVAANPDGNNVSLIAPLGENADKVTIDWSPNNQIIGTALTGSAVGGDRQEVLFVGLHGENFKSTVVEGRGLRSAWAPDGEKLLYSVYSARSDFKPELWIVNAEGDTIGSNRKLLNVNTWADKCTFADPRVVYCGVPETLQTGAGFAPALSDRTPDRLVKIDVQTGARTEIPLGAFHVIDDIFLSPDGQNLFFTDKAQTGIFEVAI